jgi:hypothetical protein
MENVMAVRRTEMVFSMKLTPEGQDGQNEESNPCNSRCSLTQRLNVIFVKTSFDILDHKTCLADLRVAHHPNFDHHAATSE